MSTQITRTNRTRIAATGAVLAGLTLALVGCGDSSDASSGSEGQPDAAEANESAPLVYDFDSAKVADSDDQYFTSIEPFTVELSDELEAAIPSGAAVAVERFTVTPTIMPTGLCRVDIEVEYADGGLEATTTNEQYDHLETTEEIVTTNLVGEGFDEDDQLVDAVPGDDEVEEGVRYLTSDYENFTMVDECSEDDSDTLVMPEFRYIDPAEDDSYFAHASISVVPGGQSGSEGYTAFVHGDTAAELSANGKWSEPE